MRRHCLLGVLVLGAASLAQAVVPVMVVNGYEVTDIEVNVAKQAVAAQLQGQTTDQTMIVRRAVDQVIARVILAGAAREAKVKLDESKVEAALAQQRQMAGGAERLAESLKEVGLTESELRRITAETMLVRQYMETVLLAGITITEEDLKAYYDEHPSEFRHSEQLKLKMVLIEAKPTADETTRAAARAKAESLHKRLLAGEDFATLAEQFSEDPTRSAGGEIGWVGKDRLLAEIEPAVFAIPTGKISDVLVSSYGYHIFKVEDRKPAGVSTLAEVKESLRGFLRGRRMESTVRAKVDTLRAGAKIVYLDPALEATVLGKPAPVGPGK